MCKRFWIPNFESVTCLPFAAPPSTIVVVHRKIDLHIEGKQWRKACAWASFLKCMQTYLFPLWYNSYYVLCIFKCVKHHACLAGPWDSKRKRDRLCFLSHGDFAFGLSLPLCWLVETVSKKPYHVFPVSLHFLCTKSKMHISSLHREMLGKENVQNLSARSSVSSAAEPSHSRQAGCRLALETAKQRRETHRHTFWSA